MSLDVNFALVILAIVAITAMALTVGKPQSLGKIASFLKELLRAVEQLIW